MFPADFLRDLAFDVVIENEGYASSSDPEESPFVVSSKAWMVQALRKFELARPKRSLL